MVARGVMLGPDQPVILHLLDIEPAKQALEGVKMELLDAAFPLLQGGPLVSLEHATSELQPQVVSVDVALLLRPTSPAEQQQRPQTHDRMAVALDLQRWAVEMVMFSAFR